MGIFDAIGAALTGAASKTAGGIIDSITKGVSTFVTTPTQKMEFDKFKANLQLDIQKQMDTHQETIQALYEKQYETQLADVKNARDTNASIQTSSNSSWMAKNIPYIIGLFVLAIWGTVTIFLVMKMLRLVMVDKDVDMTTILALYTSITTIAATVVYFYFGNSANSQASQKVISDIAKQG